MKHSLSLHERGLVSLLRKAATSPPLPGDVRTREQFVLDYGWLYEPTERPPEVKQGATKHCFDNALKLAVHEFDTWIYCEGFAGGDIRTVHHAWVTDREGRVIEITWPEPAPAYLGVPFKILAVAPMMMRPSLDGEPDSFSSVSLLDDDGRSRPLLGPLGDSPEEWFEPLGVGAASLADLLSGAEDAEDNGR